MGAGLESLMSLEARLASLDPRSGRVATTGFPVSAGELGKVTRPLGWGTPIVSDAVLTGGLEAQVLERSTQLKALIEQGDLATGLEHFKRSPADGCTSIIDLARIGSGYDPTRFDAECRTGRRVERTRPGDPVMDPSRLARSGSSWPIRRARIAQPWALRIVNSSPEKTLGETLGYERKVENEEREARVEAKCLRTRRTAIMNLILLIVVILLLFGGGGGYYAYNSWGPQGGIGIVGLVLIIVVVLFVFGRGRSNL